MRCSRELCNDIGTTKDYNPSPMIMMKFDDGLIVPHNAIGDTWPWVKTNGTILGGAPPMLVYLSGDWDGGTIWILTHSHLGPCAGDTVDALLVFTGNHHSRVS